ncbi:MAG: hypothetical protein AB8F94_04020 [Saprospiraceae bacterium]
MNKIVIVCICIIAPLFLFSQNKNNQSIASAIKILKIHEASLEQLSPFEEGGMEKIDRLNGKVSEKLLEILRMPEIVDFPKDSIPFFTVQSADRDLAIFSWLENLGGSFKMVINIFYWKNSLGQPTADLMNIEEEFGNYYQIFDLKNQAKETFYFLIGGGISCNTCRFEKALLFKTGETDLEEVFSFQIDYRFSTDILGLNFDEENQILNYEYIEDECEDDEGENCWVRGKFKFNGNTFEEIE